MKLCCFSAVLCTVYAHKVPLATMAKFLLQVMCEQPRLTKNHAHQLSNYEDCSCIKMSIFLPKCYWRPHAHLFSHVRYALPYWQ